MNEGLQVAPRSLMHRHKTMTPMNDAPNSFFDNLFISTHLGAALRRMSHLKTIPDWLKPQEYKRNACTVHCPFHTYLQRISFRRHWIPASTPWSLPCPTRWSCKYWCSQKGLLSSLRCTSNKPLMPSDRKVSSWPTRKLARNRRNVPVS